MNKTKIIYKDAYLFCLLVIAGILLRLLLRNYPNVSPIAALAMLSGCLFTKRSIAMAVPLSVMIISDFKFGGYDLRVMTSVYVCLTLPSLFGPLLQKQLRFCKIVKTLAVIGASGLMCSFLFFVVTNFAVWWFGSMYPHDFSGLSQCYVQAIPFFRYTLMGDMFFAPLFLGSYAVSLQWMTKRDDLLVMK